MDIMALFEDTHIDQTTVRNWLDDIKKELHSSIVKKTQAFDFDFFEDEPFPNPARFLWTEPECFCIHSPARSLCAEPECFCIQNLREIADLPTEESFELP